MPACSRCHWYRPVRPASQLLARALPTTADKVAEALGKVVEDEQKQRDAEAEYKRSQASAGKDTWSAEPVLSDYCGFDESAGRYYIAEVKNAGLRCADFDATPAPSRACSDCRHEVPPRGSEQDERRERTYVRLAAQNISADVKKDTTDSLLGSYRQGKAARQALEINGSYQTKGEMLAPPSYLSYCAVYSTADTYRVCLFQNPHNACPAWEATVERSNTQMPDQPSGPVVPPVFGQRQPTAGPADPQPSDDNSSSASPEQVDAITSMFSWLLDVTIDQSTRQAVAHSARRWPSEDIAGLMQLVSLAEQARAQGPDTTDFVRETYQSAVVAAFRDTPDPAAKALLALYDAANPAIADGTPPLTQEVVDSYLGILSFVDAIMEDRPWTPMGPVPRAEFTEQMASAYPTLSPQEQAWLAAIPLEWARTRALWMQADVGNRHLLAEQLVELYGNTAQATAVLEMTDAPVAPPVFGPSSASPVHAQTAAPEPVADEAREPGRSADDSERGLLRDIIAGQKKEEEDLMKTDPELALQVKLQNQLKTASLMSNMMNMRHQAAMAIIQNIK